MFQYNSYISTSSFFRFKNKTKGEFTTSYKDKTFDIYTILKYTSVFLFLILFSTEIKSQPAYDFSKLKREKLNRGVVAIKKNETSNFVSWRYLSSDPINIAFNIYRDGIRINKTPILNSTCYEDNISSTKSVTYSIKSIIDGKESQETSSYTMPANAPAGYINIPLDLPQSGVTPSGQAYTYSPNDASIGDVDGDGEYEIILKWDPSNAHDNAHRGYTGNVYFDCYKLNGTKLWRIDMGKNIRAGAHYTQFMVYDLDADGKAEIVMKTADGTTDGKGIVIGDKDADFRNKSGFILNGAEYLTVFNGLTGAAMQTIPYNPPRGDWQDWGDNEGNRVDRFLACIAYLDGEYPSVVMCRGYYTRTVLAAYDWRNGKLTERWVFDSKTPGNEKYAGQGNHNLRVGDVDGDGCDEIIYGSCAIDHNGKGLYSTGLGHGDALHLTVFDPARKGMQVWDCHENRRDGSTYRDAATGEILFRIPSPIDVGRCMAADIDLNHRGVEMWSWESKGIRNIKGECIDTAMQNISVNMACWWDGDLLRELLDKNQIAKYDYINGGVKTILTAEGCVSNNGTKATPCIQGDIIGDWREEVLLRTADNKNLRLYISTHPTDYRFHSFAEDPVYRISMATQNVAYNQPTQPGFYFGADLGKCFRDKDLVIEGNSVTLDAGMDYDSYKWSTGGSERSRTISTKDIPAGKKTKIELSVTYRGYEFKDYTYITLNDSSRPDQIIAGSSRKNEKNPVIFLIGDSTVKNGKGNGDGGQWGWGSFFEQFFDTSRISVENHALGGRSSRTFYTEGLWDKVLPGIKKGDYLFIQFGHNDGGPLNTGRARASLKGTGDESETVIMERSGEPEEVFTFGHYLRIYIRQAKAAGAIPIVLSPTPNNRYTNGKITRMTDTYTQWAREVAEQEDVQFIDLNARTADKCDVTGEEKAKLLFVDSVHTNKEGAIINGESVIEGLKSIQGFSLNQYIKK